MMDRVIITRPMIGIAAMQVCAVADATDAEILEVCNRENPSGTSNGWVEVIRTHQDPNVCIPKNNEPVRCESYPDRIHLLVTC